MPMLKPGLDVQLEFIMTVVLKSHAHPQSPRKFHRKALVAQMKQWVAAPLPFGP